MKRRTLPLVALAAAGMLALSACAGGAGTPAETTTAPEPEPTFAEGSTMATLAEAGTITIGTKFDQPLFGLKGPSGDPEGFDVEIGKIIASELGIPEDDIEWKESVSANREPFIQNGEVDLVVATYTINDKRKEVVSFAGSVLPGRTVDPGARRQRGHQERRRPRRSAGLLGRPARRPPRSWPRLGAEPVLTDTYSNCLEPLRSGAVVAVSTDNVILAGLAAQNEGEFKVVGEPFTEEPYGIGVTLDDTDFRMWINDVLEKAYEDGRYEEAWNATAGTVLPFIDPPAPDRY